MSDTKADKETVENIERYRKEKAKSKKPEPKPEPLVCDQVSQDSHGR